MNLITVTETKKHLRIQVNYSETEGTYFEMPKQPFSKGTQLRKLSIGLREMSERIGNAL